MSEKTLELYHDTQQPRICTPCSFGMVEPACFSVVTRIATHPPSNLAFRCSIHLHYELLPAGLMASVYTHSHLPQAQSDDILRRCSARPWSIPEAFAFWGWAILTVLLGQSRFLESVSGCMHVHLTYLQILQLVKGVCLCFSSEFARKNPGTK